MEADARTTMGVVVTPQILTATAGIDPAKLLVDNNDRILRVDE
jgi:hypothetical protein